MQLANPSLAPNDSSSPDDFSRPPLHRWRQTGVVPPFPLLGTSRIKRRRGREASEVVEIGIVERSKGGKLASQLVLLSGQGLSDQHICSPAVILPHHCLLTSFLRSSRRTSGFFSTLKKVPLCRIAGSDCNATRRLHIKTPANNSGGNCLSLRV